ncbi:MAG: hypothetical protein V4493_01385 [Pseudomonadota bacterium]
MTRDEILKRLIEIDIEIDSNQTQTDSIKVTVNGTFGKLGSRWSIMYAPDLLIQVTLTGQLALAMIIERMEAAGLQVVSANTDGIVLYIHESQYEKLNAIKNQWCKEASLKMEETRYKALYSRDVNNYCAVKMDDKVKLKGAYSNPWNDKEMGIFRFHKNPATTICIEAVEKMLVSNIPIEQTIRECEQIEKFIFVRDVAGGAHMNGVYLGKTCRWYYGQDVRGGINYVTNGNNVSESEGAVPLMDIVNYIPADINYNFYIEKTNAMLYDIGFYRKAKELELFD